MNQQTTHASQLTTDEHLDAQLDELAKEGEFPLSWKCFDCGQDSRKTWYAPTLDDDENPVLSKAKRAPYTHARRNGCDRGKAVVVLTLPDGTELFPFENGDDLDGALDDVSEEPAQGDDEDDGDDDAPEPTPKVAEGTPQPTPPEETPSEHAAEVPSVPEYVPHNGELEHIEYALEKEKNLMLCGPTGCGKTHALLFACQENDRPVLTIQGGGGATFEQIVGRRGLQPDGNGGTRTVWEDGTLVAAMRQGAVLYVDEPNALPEDILFYLFSAMDDRREVTLSENGNETVKAADGFTVVGAMNEGYVGTHALNAAFRSRFNLVEDLDYLRETRERELLKDRTGVDHDTAEQMVEVASRLRRAKENRQIRTPIGTRELLSWAEMVADGWDPVDAAKPTLIGKVPSTQGSERKAVEDAVDAVMAKSVKEVDDESQSV